MSGKQYLLERTSPRNIIVTHVDPGPAERASWLSRQHRLWILTKVLRRTRREILPLFVIGRARELSRPGERHWSGMQLVLNQMAYFDQITFGMLFEQFVA